MDKYLKDVVLPYYNVQSNVIDNFVIYGLDFKAIYASPSVLERLNLKKQDDIIGKTISDFHHIKANIVDKLQQIFNKVINDKAFIKFICIGGQIEPLSYTPEKYRHDTLKFHSSNF
ncbi:MAG: hypothetical protein ACK5Z5_08805 [Neisseriaceae bacterium]